ncbi:nucleoside-diphosphate-sugar epimerase [Blastomonas natatoria]|uniref:Nucleoside-diphosphate-sugar epimerase n=1 Tax=Blastomonas natatoria TaxID=34015 RepID=A0A2V3V3B7_9SPHN|nr:GDP-mannose 4,6-dehydratase [Blastomonas natatoria]PXW76282.1 nucleoside-diphosphate-sugar epimerase [Blastomonas natatoria]
MRVLVTGAEGFTGTYLVAELRTRGCDVIALASDITDAAAVDAEIASVRPDRVIHLAAIAFVGSAAVDPFYQVNQLGTFHLLEAVARHAPQAHVLIASSANIYGNGTGGYLDEATPPNPANHYAVSKWAMELGARFWADRVRMTIVRPFNYTGVGQDEQYLIPKIVRHFRRREPVITLGNIDVSRDFGDVRSVVAAYCGLSLEPPEAVVVNVCTGRVFNIRQVIAIAANLTGHEIEIATNPAFMRPNEVEILAGDATLLRRLLPSWEPRKLEDTLAWMLRA